MTHNAATFIPTAPMFSSVDHKRVMSDTSEYATATESMTSSSPENFALKKDPTAKHRKTKPVDEEKAANNHVDVKPKELHKSNQNQRSEINMDGVANVRATNDNFTLQSSWEHHVGNIKYDLPGSNKGEVGNVSPSSAEQYNIPESRPPKPPPRPPKRSDLHAHNHAEKPHKRHHHHHHHHHHQKDTRHKLEDLDNNNAPQGRAKSDGDNEKAGPVYMNVNAVWNNASSDHIPRKHTTNGYAKSTPFPTKGILRKAPQLDLSGLEETTLDDTIGSPEYSDATNGYTSEGKYCRLQYFRLQYLVD